MTAATSAVGVRQQRRNLAGLLVLAAVSVSASQAVEFARIEFTPSVGIVRRLLIGAGLVSVMPLLLLVGALMLLVLSGHRTERSVTLAAAIAVVSACMGVAYLASGAELVWPGGAFRPPGAPSSVLTSLWLSALAQLVQGLAAGVLVAFSIRWISDRRAGAT